MRQNGFSGRLLKRFQNYLNNRKQKPQNYYFPGGKIAQNHPSLFFNGTVVPKVNEQKHLGLILDSNLSFERHLNGKVMKAKSSIGIIKYLSSFLPLKILDQMYKAIVRSHLDYCDTTYHIPVLK